ncbi:MAG: SDR family NAD(P)-dependent oxidoreductase [Clostridiales bacterium]|jgi:NAD(P)-dependent dehydrogenase (short-subunit alcohol dehydrogenase family)|nr:SDR family NAD(P)-dependent oxidoreductase [Clostridiales bacterium]
MDIGRKRLIVVTGADRGLGYELTKQYLERGEIVFAGKYRTQWPLLGELREKYKDTLKVVNMDVRDTEAVRKAAEVILSHTDKIDILINNAGIWMDHGAGTILEGHQNYENMLEQFNVNALGAVRVTEALVHALLRGFDKLVVNVSSEAGSITLNHKANQIGYCMSKAAMNMMSCCILYAIRPFDGMVLNLHPGWMQSVIGSPVDADAPYVELPSVQDAKFYVTPATTAKSFIELIDEPERFSSGRPGFVNYRGDKIGY